MTQKTYRQEEDGNANDEQSDDVCMWCYDEYDMITMLFLVYRLGTRGAFVQDSNIVDEMHPFQSFSQNMFQFSSQ